METKRFLTFKEANQQFVGLSVATLYSWSSQKKYPFIVKCGSRVFLDTNGFLTFLEQQQKGK